MKKLLFSLAVVFLATIIIVSSCKKKEEEPDPEPTPTPTVSISGTVYDETGVNKVADVAITANDKTGTTDANGAFSITGITKPSGKLAVYFKKANYISASRFETVSSTLTIDVSLISLTSGIAATTNFDAAAGSTLSTSNGTNVNLPPNSIYKDANGGTYAGTVTLNMAYVDPTSDNIDRLLEGSSQMLDDAGNILESFGVLRVELMDANGNPIIFEADSLTKSIGATVGVVIPTTKLTASPESVTLYSYNTTKSAYVSSGASASKIGGQYVGEVSHFSSWNCAIKPSSIPTEGQMQYTINGGQFQSQLINNFSIFNAYWNQSSNSFKIYCNGTDGTVSLSLNGANGTANVYFDGSNTNTGFILPQNIVSMSFQQGTTVSITKNDSVGGLVIGTFSGTCKAGTDTTLYTISNGSFSIAKGADQ